MPKTMSNNYALNRRLLIVCVLLLLMVSPTYGQTTVFTYQGRLSDGGAPALSPAPIVSWRSACDWLAVDRSLCSHRASQ